jgi:hypothetical protein
MSRLAALLSPLPGRNHRQRSHENQCMFMLLNQISTFTLAKVANLKCNTLNRTDKGAPIHLKADTNLCWNTVRQTIAIVRQLGLHPLLLAY